MPISIYTIVVCLWCHFLKMSTITPIAIPYEYVELTKSYTDFDPSKYSEEL